MKLPNSPPSSVPMKSTSATYQNRYSLWWNKQAPPEQSTNKLTPSPEQSTNMVLQWESLFEPPVNRDDSWFEYQCYHRRSEYDVYYRDVKYIEVPGYVYKWFAPAGSDASQNLFTLGYHQGQDETGRPVQLAVLYINVAEFMARFKSLQVSQHTNYVTVGYESINIRTSLLLAGMKPQFKLNFVNWVFDAKRPVTVDDVSFFSFLSILRTVKKSNWVASYITNEKQLQYVPHILF